MARLRSDTEVVELPDNSPMAVAAEKFGIGLGCMVGVCGLCRVEVLDGMSNLSQKTRSEREIGLPPRERLACQAVIKKGTVKIKF